MAIPVVMLITGLVKGSFWLWAELKGQHLLSIQFPERNFDTAATRDQRAWMMQIQGHKCANPYCNADLRHNVPHWDHIIPRAKGGHDHVANMQWLCDTCNLNKGTADWTVFLFKYATGLGIDPRKNRAWEKWVTMRATNGLME
jgi:hypothetical protein